MLTLYKYVTEERIDILENCKIRFSQAFIMNDPFESKTHVSPYDKPNSKKDDFIEVLRKLEKKETEIPEYINDELELSSNNSSLILSLTEDPNNLLMWSHYANSHKGFVIAFNALDNFFHPKPILTYLNNLRKIEYSSNKQLSKNNSFFDENLFLKSTEWEYEREWRIVRWSKNANHVLQENSSFPIYLFDLPPSCIKSIILGSRMEKKNKEKIRNILSENKDFNHVSIFRASLHESQSRIELISENANTKQRIITDIPVDKLHEMIQCWEVMGSEHIEKMKQENGKWTLIVTLIERE